MNNSLLISDASIVLAAILVTILSCRWYYHRKLKRAFLEFHREINQQKDMAWRSRMNPHFIHNCLNSINSFIHGQDNQSAAAYLTCFSRLMRKVLEHSGESRITLEMELDALKDYIELELLRFGSKIDVQINVDKQLDPGRVFVPPLFLQPFIENALIHGLLPGQTDGTVSICLEKRDHLLYCCITDNGVGRPSSFRPENASPFNSENTPPFKRSLGIAITRNRIALFNRSLEVSQPVLISDLMNGKETAQHMKEGAGRGTKVEIRLALVELS